MLLFSCLEESDQIQDIKAPNIDHLSQVRNWFEENKQDLRIKDSGLNQRQDSKELILPFFEKEPDWSKFHIYQWPDGKQVYEVNLANKEIVLNSQFTDNLPDADPSKTVIQNILFVENKQNGRFDPVIARYYPADEYSVSRFEEISYNKIGAGWSGTVDIWTYDERYFVGFIIEDGQLIATKHPEGYQPDARKRKSTLQGENLDTTCRHVVSIYTVVTIVTAGNGSEISYRDETEVHMVCSGGTLYNDLDTNGTPIPRYDYDPYGGGWGGVSGEINYAPPSIIAPKIINQLKNPCASEIFLSIKRGTNSPMFIGNENPLSEFSFAEEIYRLFEDSKKFDMFIQNGPLEGKNAETSPGFFNRDNGTIEIVITLSDTYLSKATRLSIARTIIHEMVHAYIIHELNSNNLAFSSYFINNFSTKYTSPNRAHHEFMVGYVDMIAFSLKKWDTLFGDGQGHLGDPYYRTLAFGGLFKDNSNFPVDGFIDLVPDENERNQIINIIRNEQDGKSTAKGIKCN